MKNVCSNRNVFMLCLGSFISSIGDNLYNIGLTLSLYGLSGSVSAVAYMWLIRALIRIPGQFFGGIIADCFDRKKIIFWINLLSGFLCFLLVFIDKENIAYAYLIIFLLQATSDIDSSASMAMIPELVSTEELIDVNSLFSLVGTISLFVAPALAGILYSRYGVTTLYAINSVSFIAGSAFFAMIQYNHSKKVFSGEKHRFTLFKLAKEGFGITVKSKLVCSVIAMMMGFAVLGRFYEIYKVYIADVTLEIGAIGIVYFSYAMALGSLMAPLSIKLFKFIKWPNNKALVAVSLVTTFAFILLGLSSHLMIACLAVWLIGLFQTNMSVYINSTIQCVIENQYLGRVFSFYKIAIILSAIIGILIAEPLLNGLGVTYAFVLISTGTILLTFITYWTALRNEENNEQSTRDSIRMGNEEQA